MYVKQVEKLEVCIHEYSIKVEELNRTIIDITSLKVRISQVIANPSPPVTNQNQILSLSNNSFTIK